MSAREERRDGQAGRPASRNFDRNARRFTVKLDNTVKDCRRENQRADLIGKEKISGGGGGVFPERGAEEREAMSAQGSAG